MVRTYNHQKNASSLGAMFGGVEGAPQTQNKVREMEGYILLYIFKCLVFVI